LAAIQARLAAIGNVEWDTYGKSFVYDEGGRGICVADCCGDSDRADFIAAAPTDIAVLLRECEAMTADLAEQRHQEELQAGDMARLLAALTSARKALAGYADPRVTTDDDGDQWIHLRGPETARVVLRTIDAALGKEESLDADARRTDRMG
jgi:hypothetical protein